MTGLPDELVLMGDGFESDPLIYMIFVSILKGHSDPWFIWNSLKEHKALKFNNNQNSKFLIKLYNLLK